MVFRMMRVAFPGIACPDGAKLFKAPETGMVGPVLAILACLGMAWPAVAEPPSQKARLIILADMGNEPDEEQQMVHMLMYSNECRWLAERLRLARPGQAGAEGLRQRGRGPGKVQPRIRPHTQARRRSRSPPHPFGRERGFEHLGPGPFRLFAKPYPGRA